MVFPSENATVWLLNPGYRALLDHTNTGRSQRSFAPCLFSRVLFLTKQTTA